MAHYNTQTVGQKLKHEENGTYNSAQSLDALGLACYHHDRLTASLSPPHAR